MKEQFAADMCESSVIHYEVVEKVKHEMMPEDPVYDVSELFRVLGDSTRARIICALSISEMCVCDIAALLNMSNSAISHQLRVLKQSRIVRSRRAGKIVYYRLADDHISQLFSVAFDHVTEEQGGAE